MIERSDSIILGILGNLDHFRQSFSITHYIPFVYDELVFYFLLESEMLFSSESNYENFPTGLAAAAGFKYFLFFKSGSDHIRKSLEVRSLKNFTDKVAPRHQCALRDVEGSFA